MASEGVTMVEGVELWMVETAPFDGTVQRSVLGGGGGLAGPPG